MTIFYTKNYSIDKKLNNNNFQINNKNLSLQKRIYGKVVFNDIKNVQRKILYDNKKNKNLNVVRNYYLEKPENEISKQDIKIGNRKEKKY